MLEYLLIPIFFLKHYQCLDEIMHLDFCRMFEN